MEFIDLKKQYNELADEINKSINSVLNNADFIMGSEVLMLEKELASYVGVKHCITCANGTDALTLALRAVDIQENDAIFVPTFTFFATAEVVGLAKAHLVFVDTDESTFNISVTSLEDKIIEIKREGKYNPKAIIAVDLFGQPANYTVVEKIAKKYGLLIIEDGAQGFGGSINGKKVCSFGDIATTSFFPAKPLGCYGDGGAIFTNNDKYAEEIISLRFHGKGNDKYDNVRIGYNSRLDTMQAAILRVKLKAFINKELESRNFFAQKYSGLLKDIVEIPFVPKNFTSGWAQYTLKIENRDEMQKYLKEKGIPSMVYYPKCLHQQTALLKYVNGNEKLHVSEKLTQKVLSLPMHPYLSETDINNVVSAIKEFMKKKTCYNK